MKRYKMPAFLFVAVAAFAMFWLLNNSRAATEAPEYHVVRGEKPFEIRDYPALTVVTTPMSDGEMNSSFGELFRFITGGNGSSEKVAMTTPVLIDTAKEGKTMSFIMPVKTVEKGVPKPASVSVTVVKIEAARYAALRFEGERSSKNEQAAVEKLTAWLLVQKLAAKAEPRFAYYDPPWTPVFLRRNEVLIRVGE